MRQVPGAQHPYYYYLIIGAGRMAKHFCYYLSHLKLPYTTWSRQQSSSDLNAALESATHIIVLISDSAIPAFIKNLNVQPHQRVVHFSGTLTLENAYCVHPLYSFTHSLYDIESYYQVPFILDSNLSFQELLPGLPNLSYKIKPELKTFYHTLCVMSNNFTCILWKKFFTELKDTFHLPQSLIIPYLTQTIQNLISHPEGSLTGPLARKDQTTIAANLASLENDPFKNIYQAFVDTVGASHEHS